MAVKEEEINQNAQYSKVLKITHFSKTKKMEIKYKKKKKKKILKNKFHKKNKIKLQIIYKLKFMKVKNWLLINRKNFSNPIISNKIKDLQKNRLTTLDNPPKKSNNLLSLSYSMILTKKEVLSKNNKYSMKIPNFNLNLMKIQN